MLLVTAPALTHAAPSGSAQAPSAETNLLLDDGLGAIPDDTSGLDLLEASPEPQVEDGGNDFLRNVRGGATTTAGTAGMGTRRTPAQIVGGFISGAMGLVGVVMLVLIMYGGVLWMTAQGSDEKIKKARNILTSATVGLAIVLGGWSITNIIVRLLTTATGTP